MPPAASPPQDPSRAGRGIGAPALFAASTLIWGSTWLAITFQLGVVAPEISVVYRFALAAALLGGWCLATGRSLSFSPRTHAILAAQGVLMFGANYVAIYEAERHLSSGLVAVLFSTIVFMNPIGMRLVFGTPLAARTLVAAALGVAGVGLLFLPEIAAARQSESVGVGIALGLGATLLSCGGTLIAVRNHEARVSVPAGTAWGMGWGALTAAALALARGVPWTIDARPGYWLSLAYLAVFGSVVAFGAYLTLLRRVGAGRAAYVGVATPVIAVLLSTLFEGFTWTPAAVLGVALAVSGNALAMRRG